MVDPSMVVLEAMSVRNATEITSLIELKHAAERQEGRSHAGQDFARTVINP